MNKIYCIRCLKYIKAKNFFLENFFLFLEKGIPSLYYLR